VFATLAALLAGAAVASAALLVFHGGTIAAPPARDVPPEQRPVARTQHVSAARAADPDPAALPWTLRLGRSRTGLLCGTVGQVDGVRFGLVGADARFRTLSPQLDDACGATERDQATLIGARVFDAPRRGGVRTVVYGVGGDALRRVVVTTVDGNQPVKIAAGGVFVLALRGYPEDTDVRATLTFADSHVERRDFGSLPDIVPDPAGGPAWKVGGGLLDGGHEICTRFGLARQTGSAFGPVSPAACGALSRPSRTYFAIRRIEPGTGGPHEPFDGDGNWGRSPARTAIWGSLGRDVRRAEVLVPHRPPVVVAAHAAGGDFLAIFPPRVDPRVLRVRLTLRDGRVETRAGDLNLSNRKDVRR